MTVKVFLKIDFRLLVANAGVETERDPCHCRRLFGTIGTHQMFPHHRRAFRTTGILTYNSQGESGHSGSDSVHQDSLHSVNSGSKRKCLSITVDLFLYFATGIDNNGTIIKNSCGENPVDSSNYNK
jgi:hypothetical protein